MALIKVSISRHAFLHTDLPHDLPAVRCGGARIRQVVMNLVINASEALGGREGIIGLRTARVSAAAAGLDEGEYVRLEVSDTGCGMTPSDQARIFDPFYSTKFAGRGMGLAVVQGIVRDHDGVIRVSSTPGRGTTFEVYLPCAAKAVESPAPDSGAAQPLEAPMAAGILLFVEDEEMLRQPVAGMLRKNGFTVLEAGDGAVAVDVLESRDVDAMILDVTLPGVSSREVFETARGRHPKLKIVLTSAYSREAVARTFAGHEVEFFIRKPFRFVDLMELLRTALPPAQSFATQGYHRIDARGAARGKVAGGEGDGAEQ
jgi:CheY-like chemotaxis protein